MRPSTTDTLARPLIPQERQAPVASERKAQLVDAVLADVVLVQSAWGVGKGVSRAKRGDISADSALASDSQAAHWHTEQSSGNTIDGSAAGAILRET